MTQQTRTVFKTSKDSLLADNTSEAITPSVHRSVEENCADSVPFLTDSNTFTSASSLILQGHVRFTPTESAAATLTLGVATAYVFTGSTTTWTMPALIVGKFYWLKNRGSGNITLNWDTTTNFYTSSTKTSITVIPGQTLKLIGDSTYWLVE